MLLSQHQELILNAARQIHQDITDATGHQKWHRIRVHGVDIDRYRHKGGKELLQDEIFYGGDSIKLAWTLQWLLSPAAIAEVFEKAEKRTAIVKLTLPSKEEKNRIISMTYVSAAGDTRPTTLLR